MEKKGKSSRRVERIQIVSIIVKQEGDVGRRKEESKDSRVEKGSAVKWSKCQRLIASTWTNICVLTRMDSPEGYFTAYTLETWLECIATVNQSTVPLQGGCGCTRGV